MKMSVLRLTCRSIAQAQNSLAICRHLSQSLNNVQVGVEYETKNIAATSLKSHRYIWRNQLYTSQFNGVLLRTFSSQATDDNEQTKKVENEDSSIVLYRFSRVLPLRFMSRMKIYHTVLGVPLLPYLYLNYTEGSLSYADTVLGLVCYTVATSMLYLLSLKIKQIVCIMKYNEGNQTVDISHLTYWGKRRDVSVPISNIIPFSDSNQRENKALLKIETYDKSEKFLLYLRKSSVEEKDNVMSVIG